MRNGEIERGGAERREERREERRQERREKERGVGGRKEGEN